MLNTINFAKQLTYKLIIITGLSLLLYISLVIIQGINNERAALQSQVINEVTEKWGGNQTIIGPIIEVPFYKEGEDINAPSSNTKYIMPAVVTAEGILDPVVKRLGIYETVVYSSKLNIKGHFNTSNTNINGLKPSWDRAKVYLSITNPSRIISRPSLKLNSKHLQIASDRISSSFNGDYESLLVARLNSIEAPDTFEIAIEVGGSGKFQIANGAEESEVRLLSSWPNPSFQGDILPVEQISDNTGFKATWKNSNPLNDHFIDTSKSLLPIISNLYNRRFGVELLQPVTGYHSIYRSIKYGILIIILTFSVLLLFDLIHSLHIHPIQYGLVGCALVLFFLTLLSLNEFMLFRNAYFIAALVITFMISSYATSVLKSWTKGGLLSVWMTMLYSFMYLVLRMEESSMLAGTISLLVILSIMMLLTRNLNSKESIEINPIDEQVP